MSETDAPTTPIATPGPTPRSTAARVGLFATAAVTGLIALGLLAAGGFSFWADGQRDAQGYVTTGSHPFAARSAALTTQNMDVDLDGAGALTRSDDLGRIRFKVHPTSGKPVFVGIARTADVSTYLGGVAHTTLSDITSDPFSASYREHGGARHAKAPATMSRWAASTQGSGTQTLKWKVADGNWTLVVMNADGSPGIHAGVDAGAHIPALDTVGWGALGGALVMLIATAGLIALGAGNPRPPRRGAPGLAPAVA